MNKEEVLSLLRAISTQINESGLLEKRTEQLENYRKAIEDTKVEIKYLSERLTDDRNYINVVPYLKDESNLFNLEDNVRLRKEELGHNLELITEYQQKIEDLRRNIEAHNDLIASAEREKNDLSEELRDSLEMSQEEFADLRDATSKKIDRINENIESYKEELEKSNRILEESQTRLEELQQMTSNFERAIEEAETEYEDYAKEVSERSNFDEDSKRMDQTKLDQTEARLAEFERLESDLDAKLSYDYDQKISELIEEYDNGTISHDDLVARVSEIKANIGEDFIEENLEQTYSSEEYKHNNNVQDELRREIESLEEKLSNDDNYAVSPFVIERSKRNLIKLERTKSTIDTQIEINLKKKEQLQSDLSAANELIEELEKSISDKQREIRRLGVDITPEDENAIRHEIASDESLRRSLLNERNEYSKELSECVVELEKLKFKQDRYETLCETKKTSLEQRSKVDMSARRIDEIELSKKKSALAALENRNIITNVSIVENLDKLIEESNPTQEIDLTDTPEEVAEENIVDSNKVENSTVEPEKAEEVKEENQMDPIDLGENKGFRARYSGVENHELSKKAKEGKFVKALKKFFKVMLDIISYVLTLGTALVYAGLHPVKTAKSIRRFMENVQKNPEKYAGATQESIENEVSSVLKDDGVDVEKLDAENTQSEEVLQEEVEVKNDEIIVNTNKGEQIAIDVSEQVTPDELSSNNITEEKVSELLNTVPDVNNSVELNDVLSVSSTNNEVPGASPASDLLSYDEITQLFNAVPEVNENLEASEEVVNESSTVVEENTMQSGTEDFAFSPEEIAQLLEMVPDAKENVVDPSVEVTEPVQNIDAEAVAFMEMAPEVENNLEVASITEPVEEVDNAVSRKMADMTIDEITSAAQEIERNGLSRVSDEAELENGHHFRR